MRQTGWRLLAKQGFDRTGAAFALAVASPLMVAVSGAVLVTMGRPVFFAQKRPGVRGKPFTVYKFRTMSNARDAEGKLLPDEARLGRVGRAIRAASLDELPQLLNVLRGELSFVGPRPLLMQYLERYTPEQMRRHDVLPGITGWAQIHGRNATTWRERFAHDLHYVDNWSLALDAKILAKTVLHVLKREGISNEGHATMPEFMGKNERE
jgi:lipopolysaccharide/colanic/teichoic acid biosynthesis glycosyltransferase